MLAVSLDTIRVFLHVLAATVWVGGQLTLTALLPVLRGAGGDTSRLAARKFNAVAWPAFAVLVLTGVWNIAEAGDMPSDYRATLHAKIAVVAVSGIAALLHARSSSRRGLAITGSISGLTALIALFMGVQLG
ncbi:CopD family protein [Thermomonospora cellulosilytica]|uniref:Putative copper export protein n=1 Tax=Thermomonospora cellulosilytica TaxID=1411118 RepID=A0A7W3MYU0_9ACTN|nr:CopD family protein [Thermomonospora cellulosilytica]MBA9004403.1 putative copper export protein [Thermomonospora cellulosilytica]